MMTWVRIGLGTALIFAMGFSSGSVMAQAQSAPVSTQKPAALSDHLASQIKTLINAAILSGNAKLLEDGLFDLTIETPELAVLIAKYATSELPAKTPQGLSKSFSRSLSVAAAVGPATASPALYKEIIAATESSSPELANIITSEVEVGLVDLFNDDTMAIEDVAKSFSTAAGLAETPTTQSASPTG